jgi:hypothetical protein
MVCRKTYTISKLLLELAKHGFCNPGDTVKRLIRIRTV